MRRRASLVGSGGHLVRVRVGVRVRVRARARARARVVGRVGRPQVEHRVAHDVFVDADVVGARVVQVVPICGNRAGA